MAKNRENREKIRAKIYPLKVTIITTVDSRLRNPAGKMDKNTVGVYFCLNGT